ncbi:MAG: hypothetical protein U1E17_24845 [Geminicoccaceae bacterium]
MTHAAARHRDLDRRAAHAMGLEPGHALVRPRHRMKDMKSMQTTQPRVLLTSLSIRTSAKGRSYLSGFLGKARVVAFEGEADKFGNPTWDIFLAEAEPREGAPAARQRPAGSEAPSAGTEPPASARARPGSRYTAPRPESTRARQERVAGEVLADYGDQEMSDAIPF